MALILHLLVTLYLDKVPLGRRGFEKIVASLTRTVKLTHALLLRGATRSAK